MKIKSLFSVLTTVRFCDGTVRLSEPNKRCEDKNCLLFVPAHTAGQPTTVFGFVVVLLFYVHGKHLRSCRDGQLT